MKPLVVFEIALGELRCADFHSVDFGILRCCLKCFSERFVYVSCASGGVLVEFCARCCVYKICAGVPTATDKRGKLSKPEATTGMYSQSADC